MTNSVVIFNYFLYSRGLSKFTLLISSRSAKSLVFNSMFIFSLIKFVYLNSINNVLKGFITKCDYFSFIFFTSFFTLFYAPLNNLNFTTQYTLNNSMNLLFLKVGIYTSIFFKENSKFFISTMHSSGVLNLFNKIYYLSTPSLDKGIFYSYLKVFLKLKDFYKFSLINVNLSYIYLKTMFNMVPLLANFFKKNLLLTLRGLYDIFVVDYPARLLRFELIYGFTSIYSGIRVFLKTHLSENISINSISNIFSSANWLERECWDLFGVFFANHTNLRRILTDYGFRGFPFRKDFPLTGYIEVRFDDSLFSIVYEPLEITQEFRVFNFKSPWESYEV